MKKTSKGTTLEMGLAMSHFKELLNSRIQDKSQISKVSSFTTWKN